MRAFRIFVRFIFGESFMKALLMICIFNQEIQEIKYVNQHVNCMYTMTFKLFEDKLDYNNNKKKQNNFILKSTNCI